MNFKNAGVSTLSQSAAFAKIRANSKLFTTNVVTDANQFALKYAKIHEYAFNDNNFSEALTYGSVRQHNLTSAQATKNVLSTFLNAEEMSRYLNSKTVLNEETRGIKVGIGNLLYEDTTSVFKQHLTALNFSLDYLDTINSVNDIKKVNYLFSSLISKKFNRLNFSENSLLITNVISLPLTKLTPFLNTHFLNNPRSDIQISLRGENTTILPADQIIRNHDTINPGYSHPNLSINNNNVSARINFVKHVNALQNNFTNLNINPHFLLDVNFLTRL